MTADELTAEGTSGAGTVAAVGQRAAITQRVTGRGSRPVMKPSTDPANAVKTLLVMDPF